MSEQTIQAQYLYLPSRMSGRTDGRTDGWSCVRSLVLMTSSAPAVRRAILSRLRITTFFGDLWPGLRRLSRSGALQQSDLRSLQAPSGLQRKWAPAGAQGSVNQARNPPASICLLDKLLVGQRPRLAHRPWRTRRNLAPTWSKKSRLRTHIIFASHDRRWKSIVRDKKRMLMK